MIKSLFSLRRSAVMLSLGLALVSGSQIPSKVFSQTTARVEGKVIRPAASTNFYSLFLAEIINEGLKELGYQVETTQQLQVALAHAAVASNDVDFLTAHWENLNYPMIVSNGGEERLERIGVLVDNTVQGYLIDKVTAEAHNIENLEQLRDPKIARLFDADGNGKADLVGCNPGWGCAAVTEHHLEAYELTDTVQFVQGEYDALIADTITRLQQGEPILAYAYSPHWAGAFLQPDENVVWLEVPFTTLPEEQADASQVNTLVNGRNLGFAVDRIRVVANAEYLRNNPVARRWLELVSIPIEDVNAQQKRVHDGEKAPEDIRRHALEWIEANRQLFDSWLDQVRQVAG
ncbi:glycine betaine/L-proline ABC transporter substrate-binding protein ProX [Thermostichus vulcanus]|uniref:Glycine betaine/L-proline ABC transporter substrate-binding protein ProX n=1 Tax=Thermostichus vulcanus str. 'Rupite' TaxID=2813851 RepID=A0ABT0CDV2_THEVL|nr:glycine betaine/L-proline ABC transporter substrate-binding protein ProX [Thermostichus vulcanus]MCJ2543965.1 glycine betaine/L-proline ABC transporter substrate-binding protein ProX [Thermostichus vulcanus str. 'Rupite']